MKIFKLLAAVVLLLAVLLPVTACSGVDYEPIELIPAGSEMIGSMKLSEAMRDWQIYCEIDGNEDQAAWFDEKKEEFYETTGINMNDISEAVMFAAMEDTESSEEMEYAGVIMTGNFADDDLVDRISEKTGKTLVEEKVGDFSLFVSTDGESAVLPVNNTMLIMGSPDACKDCIAVANGELEPVSGAILDNYNKLGDVMMKLAMAVPKDATEVFAEQADEASAMMPVGLQSFVDMETIGISAQLTTSAFTVKMSMGFSESDAAAEAADSLNTLIDFLVMMSTEEDAAEAVERLDITASAKAVIINIELTLEELAEMLEGMEELGNMEDFPMVPPMGPGMDDIDI